MPSLLIALPSGLIVSGVATWAVRLCNALVECGHGAGLILHNPVDGYRPLEMPLDARVRVFRDSLPPLEHAAGAIEPYVPLYRAALAAMGDGPVVLSPNLVGDCYALAATLALEGEPQLRVVGWLHNDIPYEYHVQRHFEPMIARFVVVSRRLGVLRHTLPARAADIRRIPYGIEIPTAPAPRPDPAGRPIRLLYAGRMDHAQKRVLALVAMSDALTAAGVAHELALVGDGPAAPAVDAAIRGKPAIIRLGAKAPAQIAGLLDRADIVVLASRHEGLSIAVIEAMARGCVPVVTRTDSGAAELIADGVNGVLVGVGAEDDDQAVGVALAKGVARAISGLSMWRTAAHESASSRYSIARHTDAVVSLLNEVAAGPPASWPPDRSPAFTSAGGSMPPDGPQRLAALLDELGDTPLTIHGTGRHTDELFADRALPETVVAFTDDDQQRHATYYRDKPVIAPGDAARLGAKAVIISSWINQDAVWERRGVYERQGLAVYKLYD